MEVARVQFQEMSNWGQSAVFCGNISQCFNESPLRCRETNDTGGTVEMLVKFFTRERRQQSAVVRLLRVLMVRDIVFRECWQETVGSVTFNDQQPVKRSCVTARCDTCKANPLERQGRATPV